MRWAVHYATKCYPLNHCKALRCIHFRNIPSPLLCHVRNPSSDEETHMPMLYYQKRAGPPQECSLQLVGHPRSPAFICHAIHSTHRAKATAPMAAAKPALLAILPSTRNPVPSDSVELAAEPELVAVLSDEPLPVEVLLPPLPPDELLPPLVLLASLPLLVCVLLEPPLPPPELDEVPLGAAPVERPLPPPLPPEPGALAPWG